MSLIEIPREELIEEAQKRLAEATTAEERAVAHLQLSLQPVYLKADRKWDKLGDLRELLNDASSLSDETVNAYDALKAAERGDVLKNYVEGQPVVAASVNALKDKMAKQMKSLPLQFLESVIPAIDEMAATLSAADVTSQPFSKEWQEAIDHLKAATAETKKARTEIQIQ